MLIIREADAGGGWRFRAVRAGNRFNAILQGESAYFSLEEALTSAIVFAGGPSTGEQGGPPNDSEHPTTCSSGLPVNCATGTLWHRFDDLAVPGRGVPLDFARTYSAGRPPSTVRSASAGRTTMRCRSRSTRRAARRR